MYNTLKSKIQSYLFTLDIQRNYKEFIARLHSYYEIEEIYFKEDKLAVVVKDEEIGQQMYGIVKLLYDKREEISVLSSTFKIDKYIVDNQNNV